MAAAPAIAPTMKLLITVVLRWVETPGIRSSKPGAAEKSGRPGVERAGELREREHADAAVAGSVRAVGGHVVAPVAEEQAPATEVRPLGRRLQRLQHVLDEPEPRGLRAEVRAIGEPPEDVGLGDGLARSEERRV